MDKKRQHYELLEKFASDQGISLFGPADIRKARQEFLLDDETKARFDFALSLGKRLLDPVIEDIKDRPTPLYFHHYRQLNFFLDRAAFLISSFIQDRGFQALPIPASQTLDWKNQRGHLSHKKIGHLAGLGWMGRNNLLVNYELGSRFRLVTILTDMPLEVNEPLERDCGECRKCLSVCPAEAIRERREDFDHWKCFEKLREFHKLPNIGQHICGICVKACPGFSEE
jgi:epoxyqueuosine reductase QueG